MDTQQTTNTQDKQVTIDVPEDRLAEFYAFYSRFLAVGPGRRGRGRGRHGHGSDDERGAHRHGGHHRGGRHGGSGRCGHAESATTEPAQASTGAAAQDTATGSASVV